MYRPLFDLTTSCVYLFTLIVPHHGPVNEAQNVRNVSTMGTI
jgi:hypothetical protein